jgi:hypothetical protein
MSSVAAFAFPGGLALSQEAGVIERQMLQATEPARSITLGERLTALERAAACGAEENWDGFHAAPVSRLAYDFGRAVLLTLPRGMLDPEVSPDTDGEIRLDWQLERDLMFSMSVSASGRIAYAGLFGPNRVHGTEQFTGTLPPPIADGLRRLFAGH